MNLLAIFLKGFAMGAANVVPGVSGGTVAFVTGIYERLINALKSFNRVGLGLLKGGRFGAFFKHIDGVFLTALSLGVVMSIVTLAKALKYGIEEHPVLVSSVFFGLIAASIWSVFRMVRQWSVPAVIGLLAGCALAVGIAFLPQAQQNSSLWYLLVCGVVSMCSMIMPGVSGSFVLLLMGNYQLIMIESVNGLRNGQWSYLSVLAPVGVGAVLGMLLLSRVLSWLFKRHHDIAVATITGFIAGSLLTIWPWKEAITETYGEKVKVIGYLRHLPTIDTHFWYAIGCMLAGAIVMIAVDYMGRGKDSAQ